MTKARDKISCVHDVGHCSVCFVAEAGVSVKLLKMLMTLMERQTYEQPCYICTFWMPAHSYWLWCTVHGTAASLYVL